METAQESVYLGLDVLVHLVECELFDILNLIVISDRNVLAIFLQVNLLVASEVFTSDGEVLAQVFHRIVKIPAEIPITVIVHIAEIFKEELLAYHHLVE